MLIVKGYFNTLVGRVIHPRDSHFKSSNIYQSKRFCIFQQVGYHNILDRVCTFLWICHSNAFVDIIAEALALCDVDNILINDGETLHLK